MFLHPESKWIQTVLYGLILLSPAGCTFREKYFNQPVPNGSFEALEDAHPKEWKTYIWSGKAEMGIADFGHSGEHSVFIVSEEGADASWGIIVPVNPFSRYRLSGWIKTENLHATTGRGVLFNLHGMRDRETEPMTGTNDWTQVSIEFDTERNDAVHINCLFGGWGHAEGKAWFDDVQMELLSSEEIHPSVTIHTDRLRVPISPYIYGQFIEHLGRCIYGGLWAEMLEDRKFYYPVTDTYQPWGSKEDPYWKAGAFRHPAGSPWKVIGPPGSVCMETDDPFVGEHTPVVSLEGNGTKAGISQEGLALVKGKGYVGRAVLAGDADASPIEIRLTFKNGEVLDQTIEHLDSRYRTYPLKFESPGDDENAVLEIISRGKGVFRIGTVSLMPEDHVHGWRADVIRLLKELRAPIYRWPGGNFVSGYNWRDGIGDPDLRPPRKNPAWTGVEHNDVGIHEYMELMDIIDAEPFIAVNTGLGTVREVAEEVAYCNDPADMPQAEKCLQHVTGPIKE